jgi:hypothetical protein
MPIPATVERDALVAAGVALLDMTAQRSRAAALDGAHDTALPAAERAGVCLAIGRPELAKDIRHLEPGGAQPECLRNARADLRAALVDRPAVADRAG